MIMFNKILKWLKSRCWHDFEFSSGLIRTGTTGIEYELIVKKCRKCCTEVIGKYPIGTWNDVTSKNI